MAEFIEIRETTPPSVKTRRWEVLSKSHGSVIGTIGWYGGWRQYVFFPKQQTIWSAGCLDDVASFIRERMAERRSA